MDADLELNQSACGPVWFFAGLPLSEGRVDLNFVVSEYIDSCFPEALRVTARWRYSHR